MPIGPPELIIVLLIVLFVFGAGKLPQVGRDLGRGLRGLQESFMEDAPSRPEGAGNPSQDRSEGS